MWFTGLSSSGKTTISRIVYETLREKGYRAELLDGDTIRHYISKDLGYSKADREENNRRIGYIAELLTRNGVIALVAAIAPYRAIRKEIRDKVGHFLEVYVNAPLFVCEQRDRKGIYVRARAGELHGVTGIDDPYEPPLSPDVECNTDRESPEVSALRVINAIEAGLHVTLQSL